MTWGIKENPGTARTELVYSGCLTKHDIEATATKALALAVQAGSGRFLKDLGKVETLDLTTIDIYNLPERWRSLKANRGNREAILAPDSSAIMNDILFYETACQNRGWQVKIFSQRQDAIEWLLAESPPIIAFSGRGPNSVRR
jgi:hypothetical protein